MGFKYLTALQLQCYGTGDDERTRTDTFEVLSKVVDGHRSAVEAANLLG